MILDYLWKSLFLGSVSATLYLAVMILASLALKKAGARQLKWYFNSQILILSVILGGSFVAAAVDSQMLAGCFETFIKKSPSWTITRWISALWLAGFLLGLITDALRAWLIFKCTRGLRRVTDPAKLALFHSLKSRFRVGGQVELYTIDENLSPFVFGIFRHKVVIPALELEAKVLASALAHELVHVRDRDSLWLTLELFCRRILFWHPLMQVFSVSYGLCVERAADETAVRTAGIARQDFLAALLEMAALSVRGPASPLRVNASRGYRECKARIEFLLKAPSAQSSLSLPMIALAILTPVAFSFAQAATLKSEGPIDPRMCLQVKHEKLIESWLRTEPPPPPRCDK